jgi:capsular exopolysaccharide synthesis family protein
VAVAERLDSRVHEQAWVEQVSGLPVLSLVPLVSEAPLRLLSNEQRNGAMLESFRILRNNISFSGIDRQMKILAVTSPGREEGKSTTVVNLAVAMAMGGKRVLLVDGDMRRPSVHRLMKMPRTYGLTTILTGGSDLEATIMPTEIDNLFCLPSGPTPPNPAEILNSQPSRELFKKLAEMYDVVLLDCPPSIGLSDVQVVATIADGVLLVVSMNETLKPHLYIAIRTLSQVGAPLIGLVLNKMDLTRRGYGYGYYYYYYSKCYDYAERKDMLGGRRRRSRHGSHDHESRALL